MADTTSTTSTTHWAANLPDINRNMGVLRRYREQAERVQQAREALARELAELAELDAAVVESVSDGTWSEKDLAWARSLEGV